MRRPAGLRREASGVTPVLTQRALNRATLARQLLLTRAKMPTLAAVAHLVGLQAQTPQTWYVGLWSRLADLDPAAVGLLLEQRELVRVPAMRSTIHLLTAQDALAIRPLTQPVIDRSTAAGFGRHLHGIDRDALAASARELVDGQPRTAAELGRLLADHFAGRDPNALAQAARAWLPMVQVPPRGVWRRSGQARQAPLDSWLGGPLFAIPLEQLVSRYLTAFGPATVRDVQTWSGLTRLAEVLDRLRPRLQVFTDPDGAELFDLPDAPRPDADTPAPVRFLYDFDNLLLGHADRRRVLGDLGGADYATHGYGPTSQRQPASVLVDGTVACTWTMDTTPGAATLTIRPFRALNPSEHADVRNEGTALLAFLHPDRTPHVHQE